MIDKEIIIKNFSKYAKYYDQYSDIQNLCALKLINRIETDNFAVFSQGQEGFIRILDVGCGTGNYTKLLRNKFQTAQIKAMDISGEMIQIAKKKLKHKEIEFIVADGETINFRERFDIISSNVSFQWFENLEKTLFKYKELLNLNGSIIFSIFGPLTFFELEKSLKETFKEHEQITAHNFIKKQDMEKILRRLFNEVEIEEEILKEKYASLLDLLKTIKYTGTRGNGIMAGTPWSLNTITELENIYRKEFSAQKGKIITTYQVFFCRGSKILKDKTLKGKFQELRVYPFILS
ncbi:MAG: malonyl-[acyl-carrier protein] O-methyltransferase BioC [Elusimicrobia bacterium CG1_02_37_114]|nr:MAG: malonyl-[acyl-carrier protein] O-methyltransferase BioC [Elusimicrobia bacterium CG1_02_37_114]PIV53536.1 MAG: malonyl-[acyl-carrier protein] O-methyltransferase BioC [Elusimicrobia bacterium CG02_land_8_20_14_3_00_37_13]PIZ12711.1 MAG: malonyl-[acyl-carrier protein] O-methyltransferase BioC [Elusimicrobia bacterium CG_4_10_14_0_8_um_filter_37_32]